MINVGMGGGGLFFFLAAGAVSLFSFLSLAAWVEARKSERLSVERLMLYRKLAESPTPSVELVLARLREEDQERNAAAREAARSSRHDSRQGGVMVLAVAVGLSFFLRMIAPDSGVWTIGILVGLIGLVILAFSFGSRDKTA